MREMKDSGIEWVGQIPKQWNIMPNKYLMHKKKEINPIYKGEDILSLTMNGVIVRDLEAGGKMPTSFDGYQKLEKGNLLMCLFDIDVTPRCIGLIEKDGVTSPAYSQFVLHDIADASYYNYYYTMLDNDKTLLHLAKNLRHSLTEEILGTVPTLVPPIEEQKRISAILDAKCSEIDALTADIEKQIETLEAYKKSVVKEIFDSFLGNNHFVYAKLGNLSKLITKQTGFDYTNTISPSLVGELTEDTIPYLQTRHFKDNYFNYETDYYIPINVAKLFPKIVLNERCLLFSIVGASIGNVAVYPGNKVAFLGGAICKVTLLNDCFYDYIKHYMMSIYGQQQIEIKINSSAQGTITVQNVRDFKIPMFTNQTLYNEITNQINRVSIGTYQIIDDKRKQLEVLADYKKSLIYEYVTGKKEVP